MRWIGLIWLVLALCMLLSQLPVQPIVTRRVMVMMSVSRVGTGPMFLVVVVVFALVVIGSMVVFRACG